MKIKHLSKTVGLAINDYNMIDPDDKIVVGISGGVDSIALLSFLAERLRRIPVSYELHPVLIDHYNGENDEHNQEIHCIRQYIKERFDLELRVICLPILDYLTDEKNGILARNTCFKCSQIRRSELMKYAFDNSCQKLAFGHHKDDIVETILMNLIYRRKASAMLPKLSLFDGKIFLIRPMAYLEKRQILWYVNNEGMPYMEEGCPAKLLKRDLQREKIRKTVKELSCEYKNFKNNIFASMRNPETDYLLNCHFQPKTAGIKRRP